MVSTSDVFAPNGLAYGGTCLDQTGLRGNISADPLFAHNAFGDVLGDYRLRMDSPAIDAGDNAAPQIPAADLDGRLRIADGNHDGDARVDIGAYRTTISLRLPTQVPIKRSRPTQAAARWSRWTAARRLTPTATR